MTVFVFDDISATSVLFNVDADVLSLSGAASAYNLGEDDTGNATITRDGKTLILAGAQLEQLISANFLVVGSDDTIRVGDNAKATDNDDLPQATGEGLDLVTENGAALDGNNLIYGLGEGDTITSGAGDNLIFGGRSTVDTVDGSDTITINGSGTTSGSNNIFANAGDDTILFTDPTASGKTTNVYGGLGNDDVITGAAAGTVTLYGNAGNDTLNGTSATGELVIYGGNGAVDSTDGADELFSGLGNTTLYGNSGADTIQFDDFTSSASQTIYAGLDDDSIFGDAGGSGSAGSLTIFGNAGGDTIDVSSHVGAVTVFGGNGIVDTTDGADSISAGILDDAHQAVIYGNSGDDTLNVTAGVSDGVNITVYGGLGADVFNLGNVRGDSATVVLAGNDGNDTFNIDDGSLTEDASTTFSGFEEEDVINVTLDGGTATDLTVTGLGASVTIDNGAANGKYVFSNYTGSFTAGNFVISDGSVLLANTGEAASLAGTANNDQLLAGANGDTLAGAAGDDILRGGDSGDSIDGGDGVDTIDGNEGNDTITAGDGGADGGGADSSINGGEGADSITGGAFEDSIVGGTGHDTLAGGADADTLTGGIGNDVYSFAIAELDATDTNVDLITDAFDSGTDQFLFSDLDNATLRGTGTVFAQGAADTGQVLGANVGLYVATNTVGSFAEATIYSELSGIADDLVNGDILYVLMSNGTDARLARVTEAANAGTLVAADDTLEFVARLNGVSAADLQALSAGNFADFV